MSSINKIHIGFSESYIKYNSESNIEYYNRYSASNKLVCYAKLEPNTSYSIHKIDTTTNNIFIVGLSIIDLRKFNDRKLSNDECNWDAVYKYDDNEIHQFTTSETGVYCFIYFADNAESDTKIMLNEGDTIAEYEPPSIISDRYGGFKFNEDGRIVSILEMATPPDISAPRRPYNPKIDDTHGGRVYIPRVPPTLTTPPDISAPRRPYNPKIDDTHGGRVYIPRVPPTLKIGAFANMSRLKSIVIPPSVEELNNTAFSNSNLKCVYVSETTKCDNLNVDDKCVIKRYSLNQNESSDA
jgi:hypothetical protein